MEITPEKVQILSRFTELLVASFRIAKGVDRNKQGCKTEKMHSLRSVVMEKMSTSFNKILICDEMWVHYKEREPKKENIEWKHTCQKRIQNPNINRKSHVDCVFGR